MNIVLDLIPFAVALVFLVAALADPAASLWRSSRRDTRQRTYSRPRTQ